MCCLFGKLLPEGYALIVVDRIHMSCIVAGKSPCLGGHEASISSNKSGAIAMIEGLASFLSPGRVWSTGKQVWKRGW